MTNFFKQFLMFVLALISMGAWAQTPIFVNHAATGANDGTSWNDAHTTLQAAIEAASAGDIIWVAEGTYLPTKIIEGNPSGGISEFNNRDRTFTLKEGVKIYGGFAGDEDWETFNLDNRNFIENETVLSGAFTGNAVTLDGDGVVESIGSNTNNAIHVVVSYDNSSATVLDGFTISGGNANVSGEAEVAPGVVILRNHGGGIYVRKSSPTLSNLIIKNNRASGVEAGAGIRLHGGKENAIGTPAEQITISQTTILNNLGSNESTGYGGSTGGGISMLGEEGHIFPILLSDVIITGNRAALGGGARVAIHTDPTFSKVTFSNNKARRGGALYSLGDDTNVAKVTIEDSFFTDNAITEPSGNPRGGAIYSYTNSEITIRHTEFKGNKASGSYGGAITSAASSVHFTIDRSTFIENESNAGGAFYTASANTPHLITNSVFYKNHSTNHGGALTFGGGPGNIVNCTFYQNTTEGTGVGQIRITGSASNVVNIYNSIIRRESGTTPADFSLASGGVLTVSKSFVQDAAPSGATFIDTETIDPQLVNTTDPEDNGFLRPAESSLAINAGDDALYTTAGGNLSNDLDLAGNSRHSGGTIDIGAYEFQSTPVTSGNIRYVNHTATTGANNGTSWANAFISLSDALIAAGNPDNDIQQIWVAKGTYLPTENLGTTIEDRDKTFILREGVKVYGGFAGNEDPATFDLSTRDFVANETILSGGNAAPATDTDGTVTGITGNDNNTYHVVVSYDHSPATVLDGFTITGGNASATGETEIATGVLIPQNRGGGIFMRESSATLSNLVIRHNYSTALNTTPGGAGIYIQDARQNGSSQDPIEIANVQVLENLSVARGGGLYIDTELADARIEATVRNSQFNHNNGAYGGAVFVGKGVTLAITEDTEFSNNKATTGTAAASIGILATASIPSKVTINGGEFTGNSGTTTVRAGTGTTFEVTNVVFANNTGTTSGAIFAAASTVTVTGSQFTDNKATSTTSSGGAIYASNLSDVTITDSDFEGNSAVAGGGTLQAFGSATEAAVLKITGGTIKGSTGTQGGAIRISTGSTVNITGVHFENNTGDSGGALYMTGTGDGPSKVTIDGTSFKGNNATTSGSNGGGAIFGVSNSDIIVSNSTFEENNTSYWGGAIRANTATIKISNSAFHNNSASNGGAIALNGIAPQHVISNSTFSSNKSTSGTGGGLLVSGSKVDIANSTFYGNSASTNGGAIRISTASSITNIFNSIIFNNIGSSGADISTVSGTTLEVKNTITQGYSTGTDLLINEDPQFINTTDPEDVGFLRLVAGSPAIDKGDDALYTAAGGHLDNDLDLADNPRLFGDHIDLGAYEYQGVTTPAGDIIFVNHTATGTNDGTSWTNAYTDLQAALSAASTDKQIWVAAGVHKPTTPVDPANVSLAEREATFQLINGVEIYGGFVGTEDPATFDLKDRDFEANVTILTGDLDNNDTHTANITTIPTGNNSYNVVTTSGVDNTAVLDGFTITGGLADAMNHTATDDNGRSFNGAGIYNIGGNPTLANLHITGNKASLRGGGMFNTGAAATPAMTHIRITNNEAGFRGGGMANQNSSSPKLNYAVISGNKVSGWGAGLFNWSSTTHLINTQITGNVAVDGSFTNSNGQGGGMYSTGTGNPILTNVVISGNYARQYGGAIVHGGAGNASILTNSIVWANGIAPSSETNNSIYVDLHPNSSNNLIYIATQTIANNNANQIGSNIIPNTHPSTILAEEIFEAPVAPSPTPTVGGGYTLKAGSIAIDAGDNAKYTAAGGDLDNDLDLAGLLRLVSTNIDLGPYEYQGTTTPAGDIIYVNHAATGSNNGTSWTDAFTSLQAAINSASAGDEIWVAKGTYLPTDNLQGTTADRDKTFTLHEGVKVYGGFAGSEPTDFDRSTRNFETNKTILSGDFDGNDAVFTDVNGTVENITGNEENAYHVVMSWNNSSATVLDGFTIKGGNANQTGAAHTPETGFSFNRSQGGGIYTNSSSPTLHNLVVEHNHATATSSNPGAAGIYLNGGKDSYDISLFNVSVKENLAVARGAGLYITGVGTNIVIEDSRFIGNKSTTQLGGGLYIANGTVSIARSEFISNMAETSGGAVYKAAAGAIASITHSTFRNNVAGGLGAALYLNNDNNGGTGGPGPEISQSLFSGNSTIGGAAGNGNGGAVVLANSATATFRGTTFYNNTAGGTGLGGAIRTAGTSARIDLYNSILFGNSASTTATADISYQGTLNINHSITQVTGTPGVDGVLVGADPLFVSVVDTDPDFLRLSAGSPAVNSGNNDSNTDTEDLAGNTRLQSGRIDIGVYESSYENIAAISSIPGISVPSGTELADLTLPANSTTVTLSNGSTVTLPLEGDPSNWELSDGGTYNPAAGGTYTFLVPVELLPASDPNWFSNSNDLKATFAVIVQGAPTLEVLWNGQAIPTSGLRLAPNEVGELTVITSSDAVPEITANPGAPVSLSSTSSPTTVTATATGNGQITVTLPATANFESISSTIDVEVDRIVPTVQVRWNGAAIPTSGLQLTLGDPQGVLTVVTNSDAIANITADALLSLSSSTSPSNVTPVSAGSGQMTVTLAQTTRFEALTVTVEVQVNKMAQQIRLYAPQGVLLSAGTASLMEVSSTSSLPVTLSIDDPSVASLSGTDLILHKRGKVSVTATQEGNDLYLPAEPVTVEIYVIGDDDGLRVHPALSPNGDGINEYLRIDGIQNYPDNTLVIFDRSGTVITTIKGYNNDNRIFTGESIHDGTYFYRLNYTTQNGERKYLQGYFEVKR